MPIRLFNTLTRQVEELRPHSQGGSQLGYYCCGPTVYGPAHIGNFRTFVLQDVLRRVLEEDGRRHGYRVLHVRNLTDVDDKTIRGSQAQGRSLAEFTGGWTERFNRDCGRLDLLPPHHEPAATGHVSEQVALIESLLRRGHAYVSADGSVYFRIASFSGYGRLSRLASREVQTGASGVASAVSADEYDKEGAADFALWKAWKPEDGPVRWDGPAGAAPGRPGWHIECSAMSCKYLGESFDLHAGGEDLVFPHHENEIAQSECGYGQAPFARHWFHTSHLMVEGRKMSKSLGNLYTLDDLQERRHEPEAVRYVLLSGHYRQKLNFTFDGLVAAASALQALEKFGHALAAPHRSLWDESSPAPAASHRFDRVRAALADDLNTPAALGALFSLLKEGDAAADSPAADYVAFREACRLFGFSRKIWDPSLKVAESAPAEVAALAQERWAAKQRRDFAAADRLRAEIAARGWTMLDGKGSYRLERAKG